MLFLKTDLRVKGFYRNILLAIILIASKVAGSLSVRLGQPSVLGKLLIGIVLGPSVLGLVNETETLAEFSEIGVSWSKQDCRPRKKDILRKLI